MTSNKGRRVKKTRRERILDKGELSLPEIAQLVETEHPSPERFKTSPELWKRYFQSPVDKAAHTVDRTHQAIRFDHLGVLKTPSNAIGFLLRWLGPTFSRNEAHRGAIEKWLKNGDVPNSDALSKIEKKLSDESLRNHDLYNQPVCRLVRRDQLRYDPDYQAVYQLTPGDSKLLDKENAISQQTQWKQLEANRQAYWGISEVFQSLVAMFDSELGKGSDDNPNRTPTASEVRETKEFIRIEFPEGSLNPNQLNMYSPLRFWAPPQAFCRHVFHMIFWRSVITNRDLFNRPVIEKEEMNTPIAERVRARTGSYYVVINWFNVAKFRIAQYDELFKTLMGIARELSAACPKEQLLKETADVPLQNEGLVYPSRSLHMTIPLDNPQPKLKLPFGTIKTGLWELARRYQENADDETRVLHILKFIRDRGLELLLWSKYQMEIRSIGIIPIQHLYRIKLSEEGEKKLNELATVYEAAKESSAGEKRRVNKHINRQVAHAVRTNRIDEWIKLIKVYGGTHRDVLEPDRIRDDIKWLKKSERPSATITTKT